ncbi:hypothetical protein DXG01_012388 [Tephrocybe rancida]|nr:hypothetical protein DXG01_012388 [Tephrocybe rancida]
MNAIAQYKEQVNDMRSNFTLDAVIHIDMRIAESQRPRHLVSTSGLIYLVDAMNDTSLVPMDYCSSPDDFSDFVKFRFRKRLGHEVIERGAFTLSLVEVDGTQQTLGQNPRTWMSLIKPEVTITMDILVSEVNDAGIDSQPACGRLFYVARGTIKEIIGRGRGHNPASGAPKPRGARPPVLDKNPCEDLDESYFRCFRRFRVEAMTMTTDLADNGAGGSLGVELDVLNFLDDLVRRLRVAGGMVETPCQLDTNSLS